MRKLLLPMMFALSACAHTLSAPSSTAPAPLIPLRDFFRNQDSNAYQISPDARWVAYLKPYESRMNVHVRPVGGGAERRLTSQSDRDISSFFWKGSAHIVYTRDFGGDENFHTFAVDLATGKERDLTPFPGVRAEIVNPLEDIHPTQILVGLNKRDKKVFDVYRLDVQSGALNMATQNPGNITDWTVDHRGRVRAATATDGVNTTLYYRAEETLPWKKVITTNFRESITPNFFTFDNQRLYAISNLGRDKSSAVEFDPATGKEVRVLFQHPDVDTQHLSYSRKRKVLVAANFTTWKPQRSFFDIELERITNKLQAKLPDTEVRITSTDKEERVFVVRTFSDRTRGSFYLYDSRNDALTKLADLSPWLLEEQNAPMRPIEFTSRDGLKIHGYLTLPLGGEGQRLPLVLNVHGGPWSRDHWGYNPEVQFLANRGYAVLQVNYRGSTGYGRKFWEKSFKQWGKTMQDDLTDAVHWAVKQGYASADRVCIYGGSYGGYATLAGVAFTPELYRCGIDYVGVSNIFTLLATIPPYWEPMRDMFQEMVGHPEKDKELLTAASPLFSADKIRVPMLVAQGAKDPRVKQAESDQIVEALRAKGKDVIYMVKENEGHGFRNEENRFDFYEAMEKFLGEHLGGNVMRSDAAPAPAPEAQAPRRSKPGLTKARTAL